MASAFEESHQGEDYLLLKTVGAAFHCGLKRFPKTVTMYRKCKSRKRDLSPISTAAERRESARLTAEMKPIRSTNESELNQGVAFFKRRPSSRAAIDDSRSIAARGIDASGFS